MIGPVVLLAVFVVVFLTRSEPGGIEARLEASVGRSFRLADWPELSLLTRLPDWIRPTVLAMVLALFAWPIVSLTMRAVDPGSGSSYDPELAVPASAIGQWSAAASSVFVSAVVAGTMGGFALRRHSIVGGLFTFLLALTTAISAMPLIPLLLGQSVAAGCQSLTFTSGPCTEFAVKTSDPFSGLGAAFYYWMAPLSEPIPVLVLALGVCCWTLLLVAVRREEDSRST